MKVGIVDAGAMGSDIAQTFAVIEGYEVVLCDIQESFTENSKRRTWADLEKFVSKEKMEESKEDTTLSKITAGLKGEVTDCDLVVEAAIENMQAEHELSLALQDIYKKETTFSTNTSPLSMTELSSKLDRSVIGMHFSNPTPVMRPIKIIVGLSTPQGLVSHISEIAREISKTPVITKDAADFIVNRVLVPMINETTGIYANGITSAGDIDTMMQLDVNHPMGPLALGGLVDLSIHFTITEVLQSETGGTKYRPHPLLRKMVRGGVLGRKTGKGSYTY